MNINIVGKIAQVKNKYINYWEDKYVGKSKICAVLGSCEKCGEKTYNFNSDTYEILCDDCEDAKKWQKREMYI